MLQGERLKLLRISRGYTHQKLAERVDLGMKQIWRYETGENDASGDVLARFAREFNVSTDYLVGLTDDPSPCISQSDLQPKELQVISAWRRGDKMFALRTIILDE